MLGRDLIELLGDTIPADHDAQVLADAYIEGELAQLARDGERPPRVLDLGCGGGDSVDQFRSVDPRVEWVGLDLRASPEVAARTRSDADFRSFDGVRIPFEDARFDMVYCKQVLEHVERPRELIGEVARVLCTGGCFAGSTSQLEAFHSRSTWNYTPYGLKLLLDDAGLELEELRPGIDAVSLILRRGLGRPRFTTRWWAGESPLNSAIALLGRVRRLGAREVNAIKLLFAGQFAFLARRPA
jgi:SAM-dependent methyltransferase